MVTLWLNNQTKNDQEECLWQTQTVCYRHRLSMTDTDCLWQKQTVCDRNRLSVTDTDCLWQTQSVCESVQHFKTWYILLPYSKQSLMNKSTVFLLQISLKLIYALSRTIYRLKIIIPDKRKIVEPWLLLVMYMGCWYSEDCFKVKSAFCLLKCIWGYFSQWVQLKLDGVPPLVADPPDVQSADLPRQKVLWFVKPSVFWMS